MTGLLVIDRIKKTKRVLSYLFFDSSFFLALIMIYTHNTVAFVYFIVYVSNSILFRNDYDTPILI